LGERLFRMQKAGGSKPPSSTTKEMGTMRVMLLLLAAGLLLGCSPKDLPDALGAVKEKLVETSRAEVEPGLKAKCEKVATACNLAGKKTRELCPELDACEKEQVAWSVDKKALLESCKKVNKTYLDLKSEGVVK
jgi:hypothetical protein